ncbi:CCR4-NOT transcription complex subunit 3-like [Antechinus flavipes]|uniref:CCR4-NOT transcription complex subunit 3-like n=1 Tax=Antechinus flavipes TaxID=38775 RepID=UPI002235F766|nr:CCR4-NOT transcription complex subunit 3-like [Antechinus flavipes]
MSAGSRSAQPGGCCVPPVALLAPAARARSKAAAGAAVAAATAPANLSARAAAAPPPAEDGRAAGPGGGQGLQGAGEAGSRETGPQPGSPGFLASATTAARRLFSSSRSRDPRSRGAELSCGSQGRRSRAPLRSASRRRCALKEPAPVCSPGGGRGGDGGGGGAGPGREEELGRREPASQLHSFLLLLPSRLSGLRSGRLPEAKSSDPNLHSRLVSFPPPTLPSPLSSRPGTRARASSSSFSSPPFPRCRYNSGDGGGGRTCCSRLLSGSATSSPPRAFCGIGGQVEGGGQKDGEWNTLLLPNPRNGAPLPPPKKKLPTLIPPFLFAEVPASERRQWPDEKEGGPLPSQGFQLNFCPNCFFLRF